MSDTINYSSSTEVALILACVELREAFLLGMPGVALTPLGIDVVDLAREAKLPEERFQRLLLVCGLDAELHPVEYALTGEVPSFRETVG